MACLLFKSLTGAEDAYIEDHCLNCDSYLACFPLDKETEQFNSSEKNSIKEGIQ